MKIQINTDLNIDIGVNEKIYVLENTLLKTEFVYNVVVKYDFGRPSLYSDVKTNGTPQITIITLNNSGNSETLTPERITKIKIFKTEDEAAEAFTKNIFRALQQNMVQN